MQTFMFFVFTTFVALAVAFLTVTIWEKFMGTEGPVAKYGKFPLIILTVMGYNFLVLLSGPTWCYVVGALPFLGIVGIWYYYHFGPGKAALAALTTKPVSKKSQRIHAAREKRGKK